MLHAALGCVMASAGGNNCASGAAAGVIGESIGSQLYDNGNGLSRKNTIAASQISGALAAAMVAGPDDGDSVFAGSQIGRNAAENNVISAQAHQVQINKDLKSDSYHFSWLIVPDDQNAWKDHPDFKNNKTIDGKVYATIGGGPDSPFTDFITEFGLPNLHGGINRQPYDTDLTIKTFSVQIEPTFIGNENAKIQQLLDLNKNFETNPNKLNYWFFPENNNNFYNSNSYFTGIGQAAKLPIPQIDIKAPGYNKAVPSIYFINSEN